MRMTRRGLFGRLLGLAALPVAAALPAPLRTVPKPLVIGRAFNVPPRIVPLTITVAEREQINALLRRMGEEGEFALARLRDPIIERPGL